MTDTEQSAVATLRELLPGLEREPDHWADRALTARVWCALRGWTLLSLDRMSDDIRVIAKTPDGTVTDPVVVPPVLTSLDAADDLVRECGFLRSSGDNLTSSEAYKIAEVFRKKPWRYASANYPNNEPRAILSALVRVKIAELEAKDANV